MTAKAWMLEEVNNLAGPTMAPETLEFARTMIAALPDDVPQPMYVRQRDDTIVLSFVRAWMTIGMGGVHYETDCLIGGVFIPPYFLMAIKREL